MNLECVFLPNLFYRAEKPCCGFAHQPLTPLPRFCGRRGLFICDCGTVTAEAVRIKARGIIRCIGFFRVRLCRKPKKRY